MRQLIHKRPLFAVLTFILTLCVISFFYYQKAATLHHGASFFMPIYPLMTPRKDQRSFPIDYISPIPNTGILSERGKIVITIDPMRIGQFKAFYQKSMTLSENDHLLSYRIKRLSGLTSYNVLPSISFADDDFIIPVGESAYDYVNAVYAFLRVGKNGRAYLIGLADKDFRLLGQKPFDF